MCGEKGHSWRDCDELDSLSANGSSSSNGGDKKGYKGARGLAAMETQHQDVEEKYPAGGYLEQIDRLREKTFGTVRR